jgi:APA family basic amino acid/polyamine antiporter
MANQLWIKKPLAKLLSESSDEGNQLKRSLSSASLVALGIGAIIGAGLFSLTGIAAAEHAGPAVTISFILAAVGCGFAGLCYAEFASMIPIAGSAYTYSYATMGEFVAWIIGWDLVLEYALGAATVAVSWSRYLLEFLSSFGIHLPVEVVCSPFEKSSRCYYRFYSLVCVATWNRRFSYDEQYTGSSKSRSCADIYRLRMEPH